MTYAAEASLQRLIDKDAIRDRVFSYFRSIDRLDGDLLKTVFWPDATLECGAAYSGPAWGLLDWAFPALAAMDQTMHMVGNMLIEITAADAARAQSYVHAYHRTVGADGERADIVVGLRYLDLFERRGGEWRIAARVMVPDWFREYDDSADWQQSSVGMTIVPGSTGGARKPLDRIYQPWFGVEAASPDLDASG